MKTLTFTKENKDVWFILYSAFSHLSTSVLMTIEHFDIAYTVLKELQSIASVTKETEQVTYRSIHDNGGEITLSDEQFEYLKNSVYPPNVRWENRQLEHFARLKFFLDSC